MSRFWSPLVSKIYRRCLIATFSGRLRRDSVSRPVSKSKNLPRHASHLENLTGGGSLFNQFPNISKDGRPQAICGCSVCDVSPSGSMNRSLFLKKEHPCGIVRTVPAVIFSPPKPFSPHFTAVIASFLQLSFQSYFCHKPRIKWKWHYQLPLS
jgi:hypothetical protein